MRGLMEGVSMTRSGGVLRTIEIPPYADGAYAGNPFAMTAHVCARPGERRGLFRNRASARRRTSERTPAENATRSVRFEKDGRRNERRRQSCGAAEDCTFPRSKTATQQEIVPAIRGL